MNPPLFVIDNPTEGRLATMARPLGGTRLAGEMSALRRAGVDLLVSALTDDELSALDLAAEPAAATDAGLDFVRFQIPDAAVTDDLAGALVLADRLAAELRAGRFVVTHCHAGIGRSSMLAGATLVRLGVPADQAWARITAARGRAVPDNVTQQNWLYLFTDAANILAP